MKWVFDGKLRPMRDAYSNELTALAQEFEAVRQNPPKEKRGSSAAIPLARGTSPDSRPSRQTGEGAGRYHRVDAG